jgi:cell division protein FtsL
MSGGKKGDPEGFVTSAEFYKHMLRMERRVSRLEVILYINLIVTLATLIRSLLSV